MSRVFLIQNDIIENIIEVELPFTPEIGFRIVDAEGVEGDIGWIMSGDIPIRPILVLTRDEQIREAEETRDTTKVSTIAVTGLDTFKADTDTLTDISCTIDEWTDIQNATGNKGTVDWILNDKTSITLTLADLKKIKLEIVLRRRQADTDFTTTKDGIP